MNLAKYIDKLEGNAWRLFFFGTLIYFVSTFFYNILDNTAFIDPIFGLSFILLVLGITGAVLGSKYRKGQSKLSKIFNYFCYLLLVVLGLMCLFVSIDTVFSLYKLVVQ